MTFVRRELQRDNPGLSNVEPMIFVLIRGDVSDAELNVSFEQDEHLAGDALLRIVVPVVATDDLALHRREVRRLVGRRRVEYVTAVSEMHLSGNVHVREERGLREPGGIGEGRGR